MPTAPRKAPFRCPHCGFVQDEPEHLISTYCRGCGKHYEAKANPASRAPAWRFQRGQRRGGEQPHLPPGRKIVCHHCGGTHEVSGHALTTFCPNCNATINLSDVTISSIASKPIDTRGKLTVTPSGHLSSALTICSEAFVDGRVTGTLVCETTLTLAGSRRISCQMVAGSIVIERRARLEFTSPVRAGNLTVHGQAGGTFECGGEILITKGGLIEGRIVAKSVIVEDGGILLAESTVRPRKRGKLMEDGECEGPFFIDSLPAAY